VDSSGRRPEQHHRYGRPGGDRGRFYSDGPRRLPRAKSDAEHYAKEREREKREVAEIPHEEMREVAEVFQEYGLTPEQTWPIVEALRKQPKKWIDFMMRFELGLEKPDPKRALTSAITIRRRLRGGRVCSARALYIDARPQTALFISIGVTLAALFNLRL